MSKYLISDLIFQFFHSYRKKGSQSSLSLSLSLSKKKRSLDISLQHKNKVRYKFSKKKLLHLADSRTATERVKMFFFLSNAEMIAHLTGQIGTNSLTVEGSRSSCGGQLRIFRAGTESILII